MVIDDRMLKTLATAIIAAVDPELLAVFGSTARGERREDSDVDLIIIERESFGPNRSRSDELRKIRKALLSFPFPKDILVFSQEEVTKWRDASNHVIARALREGKVLYERA